MTACNRTEIMPGVFLNHIREKRFHAGVLSVSFICPLRDQTAAAYALLPGLLRRGSQRYPDMNRLAGALDELYGARIEPYVRKKGEMQAIGFVCDTVDGGLTPDGGDLTGKLIDLVCSLITEPAIKNGAFCEDAVESEKEKLLDRIASQINDKRIYANKRLTEIMCAGEPFAVDELGAPERVKDIRPDTLAQQFAQMIAHARCELYYCGPDEGDKIAGAFSRALAPLLRGEILPAVTGLGAPPKEPRAATESMDVTQGKLAMGFRTGITAADDRYPALMLANAIYGAGTTSKLFLNVRERMSLCYYASSALDKCKGIMIVSSGIDPKDYEAARDEILHQLALVKAGEFTKDELVQAGATVKSSLKGLSDSPARMEDFTLGQIAAGSEMTLADLIRRIDAVTAKEVAAAANRVLLDTIYFLKGEGGEDA